MKLLKIFLLFFCLFGIASSCCAMTAEEQRVLRQTILYKSGSNYLTNTYFSGNKVIRWNKACFPIKVYIGDIQGVPNYYKYAFIKSVAIWQSSLDGALKFALVPTEKEANIVFKVVKQKELTRKTTENDTHILAYTEPVTKDDKLLKMNIYFYQKGPDGKFYTPNEVLNLAVHEMGHAIGISGHSNDSSSVMYTLYNPKTSKKSGFINRQDKNTVLLLYKITPDVTNGDKTKEIGTVSSTVVTGSEEERLNDSIKKELKDSAIAPKDCMTKIRLAALYQEKNDYANMFKFIKEAETSAKTKTELYSVYLAYGCYYYEQKNREKAVYNINKALTYEDNKEARELLEYALKLK